MAFKWTLARLARTRSAVRAYNRAITMKAKELASQGIGDYSMYLPAKISVQEVQERISNVNDYRRIVGYKNDLAHGRKSELTRILKAADPHALDIEYDEKGRLVTRYEKVEKKLHKIAIKRQRRKSIEQMQEILYEGDSAFNLKDMTAAEYAAFVSDTDMREDSGEFDYSVEDVDQDTIRRWEFEDLQAKRHQIMPDSMYEVYRDTWTSPKNYHSSMPGYQELLDALEWVVVHRTDVLNKMFNSGRDEIDPNYITESGGNSNPYVNIDYEVRHNRAVRYILNTARSAGYEG